MAETLTLKIKGLFTSFNEFSEAPEGALAQADNIDIIQDSVAQPRRGFDREATGYTDTADRTDSITEYLDKPIAHHGTLGAADTLSYYSSDVWTSFSGSPLAPSGVKMRFAGANQNLYYTTSLGLYKIAALASTPVIAGAYKGLDVTAAVSASTSVWLTAGYRAAYRVIWGYKDTNDNLILGAPSQRVSIKNTHATDAKAIDLTITIPAGVTTSWFYQVYRSSAVDNTAATIEPNDELGLVYEANPSSAQITAKSIAVTDIVPDSLRGATIYTASSQEGLAYQNEQPPLAKDIALFRDCLFYLNTTSKQRFKLTLISVGGSAGVVANDTITIGGIAYTAKTIENVASAHFLIPSVSVSAADDISTTAESLVRVINQHASSTVYAYYLSGPDDLPGLILLEERNIGGATFPIIASRGTSWNPSNIPTSGTATSSSNDVAVNGVSWSKPSQPESVPLPNTTPIGSKNDSILRGIALRDALYVFKESGQVYKISGYYPNFQVDKVEDSVKLIAPETAQVLNNQIFCLSDQGVVIVSDSTKVISRPIEQDLLSLVNQNYSLVQSIAFGISYESDRKYYLFLPSSASDTYPTQAYVYNIFTQTWVRHTLSASCGYVDSNNDYRLGDGASNFLLKERKNYSFLDFVDYGFATTITSNTSGVIVLNSGLDNVAVGDILYQAVDRFAVVSAVDLALQTVTVDSDPGLTVAAVTVLKGIETRIEWVPLTLANPGIQKQFHTATLLFKTDFHGTAELGFSTDISQAEEVVEIEGQGLGLWGLFGWGEEPWGGEALKRPVRQWIPRAKQRCSQLTVSFSHTWGFSNWQLAGLALFGTPGSENVSK